MTKAMMDDGSLTGSSIAFSVSGSQSSSERDEIQEVRKTTQRDTNLVLLWRSLVILALMATATAVIFTTHRFLIEEQDDNFEVAFEQFSRTVTDAAIAQQMAIRDGYQSLANAITAAAQSTNGTFPFYTLPLFESYARNFFVQTRAELLTVLNRVRHDQREAYENYTLQHYDAWMREGHGISYNNLDKYDDLEEPSFHPFLTRFTADGLVPEVNKTEYFAGWTNSPPPRNTGLINWNIPSIGAYDTAIQAALQLQYETVSTGVRPYSAAINRVWTVEEHAAFHSQLLDDQFEHPHSFMFYPVHEKVDDPTSHIVAMLGGGVAWDASLKDLLPDSVQGIHVVIKNNCNQSFTYVINGPSAIYLGPKDLHESKYDHMMVEVDLALHTNPDFATTPGHCMFQLHIYPTEQFDQYYHSDTPRNFAIVLALTFAGVVLTFCLYDTSVQSRNNKMIETQAQSNSIVTSMVPSHLRDRILNQKKLSQPSGTMSKKLRGSMAGAGGKDDLLGGKSNNNGVIDPNDKPLADLFLETTVCYADIAGFTSWSSVREPSQVFVLLETVFVAFDAITKKRRAFKIETVGDCYVAVAGLPNPQKDHAVIMARWAHDCLHFFSKLSKQLEVKLGPDTGEMALRLGIHSGPVTAGILRGERGRFQLFGDTMNTASRMGSTSARGRIQVSFATANLLKNDGKESWLVKRDEKVDAKGIGEVGTYWLNIPGKEEQTSLPPVGAKDFEVSKMFQNPRSDEDEGKSARLIEWNLEMMLPILQRVVARRKARERKSRRSATFRSSAVQYAINQPKLQLQNGNDFVDEVKEIVALPAFDSGVARAEKHGEVARLSDVVVGQLREYIKCVAELYRDNAFHSFEHASHVCMSINKLLSRIVAPTEVLDSDDIEGADNGKVAASLHDHTYGITSDPLTQFACVFSGLIHDADHTGVPNTQVLVENPQMASKYNERSVAEQNSLDLAWNLLMQPRFQDLQQAICGTPDEMRRFRELVVNSVMATDIADKNLKQLRNARWEKAFHGNATVEENAEDAINRKATIVIEHLIQASDISHTMQHWHVYRKWNERLFEEMYMAYKAGRSDKNPADFWAKGEIGFFDFYIIPLAKKLKDCGVFGVSSGEFLDYAMKNRMEWEKEGPAVVAGMLQKLGADEGSAHYGGATVDTEIEIFSDEVSI